MSSIIRHWKTEDAPYLAAIANNPHIRNNLRDGFPYPYTTEDALDFIHSMLTADPGSTFAYAIIVDEKPVGSIGAFRQTNIHSRTAELGYYVAEEYRGRGIASAAVKSIVEYVFENTDIVRIFAEPFARNAASCRVLEKCGFSYEGTMRKNAFKNGRFEDMRLYAILKTAPHGLATAKIT